jgi:hypothetical protein
MGHYEVIAGIYGDKNSNIYINNDFYIELLCSNYVDLEKVLSEEEYNEIDPLSLQAILFENKELVEYYKSGNIDAISLEFRENLELFFKINQNNLEKGIPIYQGENTILMKRIFLKILEYLKNNSFMSPLDIWIQDYKEEDYNYWSKDSSFFYLNNEKHKIYTEVFNYDEPHLHKDEVEIRKHENNMPGEHAFWLKAKPEIEIGDKKFKLKIENIFNQWEKNLEQLIDLCNKAIILNKALFWAYLKV